jgi:hypothetical protein
MKLTDLQGAKAEHIEKPENEFNTKIEDIISSLKKEVRRKNFKKKPGSRIKIIKHEASKIIPNKENKRPMTSTILKPKRMKNSRIKSNITKMEKQPKSQFKKSAKVEKNSYISREKQNRRIQSAYNSCTKPKKFRIRRRQASMIREPNRGNEKKLAGTKMRQQESNKDENWKRLVNQETVSEV